MVDKEAYTPVTDAPALSHCTSLSLIDEIVGVNGKGLVPGGVKNRSQRSHYYFVGEQPPNDGSAPNLFWKDGTDCVTELHASAAQAHYECLQTDNGTILIGSAVSIKFLARIILLGSARYTILVQPECQTVARGHPESLHMCEMWRPVRQRHTVVLPQMLGATHVVCSPTAVHDDYRSCCPRPRAPSSLRVDEAPVRRKARQTRLQRQLARHHRFLAACYALWFDRASVGCRWRWATCGGQEAT